MTDSSQIATDSEFSIIKLKNSLQELVERSDAESDANTLLSEATSLFKDFFTNLAEPEFKPQELITGDTPKAQVYNDNLRRMYNDISRFYEELRNLASASVKTYNYSQVVIGEVRKRAAGLASIVLDLNILSNFNRGDVIVAGDDFINLDRVDTGAALGAAPAELISNGAGLSLARSATNNLSSDPRTKIQVFPVAPPSSGATSSSVNVGPTPGNFNRFYEGNYYNFLGQARPEGGKFNIQYILDPSQVNASVNTTQGGGTAPGPIIYGPGGRGSPGPGTAPGLQLEPEGTPGAVSGPRPEDYFLEYGASEESKKQARRAMLDNNPDTFWECEYLVRLVNPLIADISESLTITEEQPEQGNESGEEGSNPDAPTAAAFQIDVADLNTKALSEDNLDLVVEVVITLPEEQNVNFLAINPIVFSQKAFIEVEDISTINSTEGDFSTVDNWDTIRFPKTITPEANEFLTDSQLSASLSPNRYSYLGQGIYPFPLRVASKIKVRLRMAQPSSQVYERTYALLKNNVDVKTTTTTTTTRGYLRF
tara:strand:+ start:127367 stop:128983 length:1617 start_codon:yes stop_codon:yes gene_type:complete